MKNVKNNKKDTKGALVKTILVLVFGIILGIVTLNANLTLSELLVFLQITLIACVLALVLDVRKILLTGKE